MPVWVGPVVRYMLVGLGATVWMAVISVSASIVVGVALGTALTLRAPLLRLLIRAYVGVWRGLPIIITLFFVFFTLPVLNLRFSAFVAATIGLSLWGSANVAEIVRGAVQSIPVGQHQAAAALGLTWTQSMIYVILPQAVRRMLPPLVSLLTNLIQSTSLAAVISVLELLEAGRRSIERLTVDTGQSHAVAILGAALAVYFIICIPLTRLSQRLEQNLLRPA